MCMCEKRKIWRNWHTQLWRPRSSMGCCPQAGNSEKLGTWWLDGIIQSGSRDLKTGEANEVYPSLKAEKKRWYILAKTLRQKQNVKITPSSSMCSIQAFSGLYNMFFHILENKLLYSVHGFKCKYYLETPSQTHPVIVFYWAIHGPNKLAYKINHHR